ncbi:hypothetical protein [Agathobacter sp.]|nr:hypothetical protein [Agathobacter sp.]
MDLKIAPTLVCPYCGEEADMQKLVNSLVAG